MYGIYVINIRRTCPSTAKQDCDIIALAMFELKKLDQMCAIPWIVHSRTLHFTASYSVPILRDVLYCHINPTGLVSFKAPGISPEGCAPSFFDDQQFLFPKMRHGEQNMLSR